MIRLPKTFVRVNKFNAKRCTEDGYKFDSLRERKRYQELRFLQHIGHISKLEVHPTYVLKINDVLICKMLPDFRYVEQGKIVVEDVKSPATITDVYKLKRNLLKAIYGIEIKEIFN